MRTPFSIIGILLFVLVCSVIASPPSVLEQSDSPLLIIWQHPDYPGPQGFTFPDGLIAAVWSDGSVIRAKDKKNVGKTYIEGHARPKEFSEFLRFILSPILL